MTTPTNKALAEADARLEAAEKRLKQARNNRMLVLQRANKAKDDRRTRTEVLTGVSLQYGMKTAETIEERIEIQEFIRKYVDKAFAQRKEADYKAVISGLAELAADYPALDGDNN